jgi:hypothetical protein
MDIVIHKSFSKNDLIDIINFLDLKIIFSHQDQKKDLQKKIILLLGTDILFKDNFYKINNKHEFIEYLQNRNPKKTLSIKEKNDVMSIAKKIIHYCKNDFNLNSSPYYTNIKEIIDDAYYISQFGDIPSCRKVCAFLKKDPKINVVFNPLISPQVQKNLVEKKSLKKGKFYEITIRQATKENPIILRFD